MEEVLMKYLRNALLCVTLAGLTACATDPAATGPAANTTAGMQSDKKAPTKPTNFQSTGNTSWGVSLSWDASTDNSGSVSYKVKDNWGREISVAGTSVTWKYPAHPPLQAGSTYSFSVYAIDPAGNKSAATSPISVSLPADNTAPSVPTFSVTSVGTRHISLRWSSSDDSPFMSYKVTKNGVQLSTGWLADSSRTFTLLEPATTYTFTAQARDQASNVSGGNTSAVSSNYSVTTDANDGSDVTAPTQPSSVWADGYGDLEFQCMWSASTDNVTPQNVIIYEMYVNGVHENTAIGKTQTSGYGVSGENEVTIVAIDEAGNRSVAGTTTVTLP
jgi:hypothetical protein